MINWRGTEDMIERKNASLLVFMIYMFMCLYIRIYKVVLKLISVIFFLSKMQLLENLHLTTFVEWLIEECGLRVIDFFFFFFSYLAYISSCCLLTSKIFSWGPEWRKLRHFLKLYLKRNVKWNIIQEYQGSKHWSMLPCRWGWKAVEEARLSRLRITLF